MLRRARSIIYSGLYGGYPLPPSPSSPSLSLPPSSSLSLLPPSPSSLPLPPPSLSLPLPHSPSRSLSLPPFLSLPSLKLPYYYVHNITSLSFDLILFTITNVRDMCSLFYSTCLVYLFRPAVYATSLLSHPSLYIGSIPCFYWPVSYGVH